MGNKERKGKKAGWWANVATLDALSSAKVLNKWEIKKEKGEKFENNVGMTIFLPKYLEL